jgi:hypothetical protein
MNLTFCLRARAKQENINESIEDPRLARGENTDRIPVDTQEKLIFSWPVGFWAAELTHAYKLFLENGYDVTIASPKGGRVEIDALSDPRDSSGYSKDDAISLGYFNDRNFMSLLDSTSKVSDLSSNDFEAIIVVEGQGPMFTFRYVRKNYKNYLINPPLGLLDDTNAPSKLDNKRWVAKNVQRKDRLVPTSYLNRGNIV